MCIKVHSIYANSKVWQLRDTLTKIIILINCYAIIVLSAWITLQLTNYSYHASCHLTSLTCSILVTNFVKGYNNKKEINLIQCMPTIRIHSIPYSQYKYHHRHYTLCVLISKYVILLPFGIIIYKIILQLYIPKPY